MVFEAHFFHNQVADTLVHHNHYDLGISEQEYWTCKSCDDQKDEREEVFEGNRISVLAWKEDEPYSEEDEDMVVGVEEVLPWSKELEEEVSGSTGSDAPEI